jgi:hypothetical protein
MDELQHRVESRGWTRNEDDQEEDTLDEEEDSDELTEEDMAEIEEDLLVKEALTRVLIQVQRIHP